MAWFLKLRIDMQITTLPLRVSSSWETSNFKKEKERILCSLSTKKWHCTNGSSNNCQQVAFTLAFVTHAGKTGTRQTGHPCCSWAKQQKTMVPSEMARRQRNPARPSFAQHDLCCPPQPAAGTRPRWGEPTVFTHLWGPSPVMGLFVQVLWRFQHSSEISSFWTAEPSLSQSQALVIVPPKEILFPHYFYSSCSRFNETTSKSLQVIAYIEEPRRTVWKKQRKTTRVMTREEFS